MDRTLNQVLEARYEEVDPEGNFARLLDILSAGRDDSRLMDITLDVYGKIQSAQDPLAWLEVQRKALDLSGVTDVGQTPGGPPAGGGPGHRRLLGRADGQGLRPVPGGRGPGKSLWGESPNHPAGLGGLLPGGQPGVGPGSPGAHSLSPAEGCAGGGGHRRPGTDQSHPGGLQKGGGGMLDPFASDSAALLEDMALVYPAMMGLVDLVEDFSQAYAQEKKKRNLLDFSDLEHFAVRLLTDEVDQPTDLARQWGAQYTEIMVDEYQDTNEVQNTIFQALSQGERNLFLVGDVKQSIYRFRLADPTIFLEKYRTFPPMTRPGRGGEPADHPVQKLPLPPPGAGGGQRPVPQHHVPPVGEMDLYRPGGPLPGGPSRKGGGADGVPRAGLHPGPRPHPG